jgi:acetyl-CoA synthetase
MAKEHLDWHKAYKTVQYGNFKQGDVTWFPEGGEASVKSPRVHDLSFPAELNAAYNCVDRHAYKNPDKVASFLWRFAGANVLVKVAIIWEA